MDPIKLFKHKSRVEAKQYIKHEHCKFAVKLAETSVMYFILSFLPQRKVIALQLLNKRFRDLYVPITLNIMTARGSV